MERNEKIKEGCGEDEVDWRLSANLVWSIGIQDNFLELFVGVNLYVSSSSGVL